MVAHPSQSRVESRTPTSRQLLTTLVSQLRALDELMTPFENKPWKHKRRMAAIRFYERVLNGQLDITREDFRELINELAYQLTPSRADLPTIAIAGRESEIRVFFNQVPIQRSEIILDYDSALYYSEYITLLIELFKLTKQIEEHLLQKGIVSPKRLLYCLCYPCPIYESAAVITYGSEWAALRAESRVIPSPQISESCLASMRISRPTIYGDYKP